MLKIESKNIYILYVVSIDIQVFSLSYTHTEASGYSETRKHTWCLGAILIPVDGCQSAIMSEYGLHMILRKGCLDTTRLWGDVDFCNCLVSEFAHFIGGTAHYLVYHGRKWVPQGTGWDHHSIWMWTGRSNSQQTRPNPAGRKFPHNSASHALFLWGWWAPRIPAGSHPMPQGCDAWAAALYPHCACCRTKFHSHHHCHPVQTCSAGTRNSTVGHEGVHRTSHTRVESIRVFVPYWVCRVVMVI